MATALPTNLFDNLFEKLIGSQTNTNVDEQLGVKNLIQQLLKTTQNQQSNQQTNQQQTTNQNVTGTTQQTQSSNADVSALQKVFAQQQAGVTPDMLKAIFSEGAKAAPQLIASTANAVGARSGTNSPLATALTELSTNLTNQAATLNQSMLKDSAGTASQIADLTKSLQTSGNTNQGTTGTLGTVGNTSGNVNTTGTQDTSTDQTQNSTKASDTVQRNTINAKSSAMTAGGLALASLLKGGNMDWLSKLIGGSGGGLNIPGDIGGTLVGFDNGAGAGNVGLGDGTTPIDGSVFGGGGIGDFFSGGGGWADGGLVDIPRLMLANSPKSNGPSVNQLLGLKDDPALSGSEIDAGSLSNATKGAIDAVTVLGSAGGNEGVAGPSGNMGNINLGPVGKSLISFMVPTVLGMIAGPAGALAGKVVSSMINSQSTSSGPGNAPSPVGSVSIGAVTADGNPSSISNPDTGDTSPAAGPSGVTGDGVGDSGAASGVSGDGVGGVGDSGDSGDGGSGWANGGLIPAMLGDPKGIKDNLHIPVSGGEYVMPADVTSHPGVLPLLDMIKNMLHTPAEVQRGAA